MPEWLAFLIVCTCIAAFSAAFEALLIAVALS